MLDNAKFHMKQKAIAGKRIIAVLLLINAYDRYKSKRENQITLY